MTSSKLREELVEAAHIAVVVYIAGIFAFHASPGYAAFVAVFFAFGNLLGAIMTAAIRAALARRNARIVRERSERSDHS